jgi:hypothetical protein
MPFLRSRMVIVEFRRFCIGASIAVIAAGASPQARAADPCALVTTDEVAAAIGGPLSDFKIPVGPEKNGGTGCIYYAASGSLRVSVGSEQFGSAAAAQKELAKRLSNDKTAIRISGVGDAAFEAHLETSSSIVIQAAQGPRIISLAVVGKDATNVPEEQLRALMQKAFSR